MNPTLLAVGDNVVDRYPDLGFGYPGGNAVNVAVHARRCGTSAAYIGALGTDASGRTVLDALVAEGVDTSLVRVVDGPNAYAEVRVVDGNRVFTQGVVGVSRFTLRPADFAAAAAATVVHTGECSMVEEQLSDLKDASTRLSFDFSERPADYVARYAPFVDIAIRSMPHGSPEAAVAAARELQALGPRTVAVTLGSRGAVVVDGGLAMHAPAPDVSVVDTLGAGDAFIARLLTGLVAGEPLDTLVGAATAYASESCTTFGAFGHETPLDLATSPMPPIHKGVDLS
jgi:fructoselysine 6-kinase